MRTFLAMPFQLQPLFNLWKKKKLPCCIHLFFTSKIWNMFQFPSLSLPIIVACELQASVDRKRYLWKSQPYRDSAFIRVSWNLTHPWHLWVCYLCNQPWPERENVWFHSSRLFLSFCVTSHFVCKPLGFLAEGSSLITVLTAWASRSHTCSSFTVQISG